MKNKIATMILLALGAVALLILWGTVAIYLAVGS